VSLLIRGGRLPERRGLQRAGSDVEAGPGRRLQVGFGKYFRRISQMSHARPVTQSRLTVARETPSAAPAKNRNSITRPCCGSSFAGPLSASSSATLRGFGLLTGPPESRSHVSQQKGGCVILCSGFVSIWAAAGPAAPATVRQPPFFHLATGERIAPHMSPLAGRIEPRAMGPRDGPWPF
jgi:hypothetical protein